MKVEDALITQGWNQGEYRKEGTGEVCFFGALFYSVAESWDHWDPEVFNGVTDPELHRRCDVAQMCATNRKIVDLVSWNDAHERTKDQILEFAREVDAALGLD